MDGGTPELTAILGIEEMKRYFVSIGMPTTLSELDVHESDFELLADNISQNGKRVIESYVPLDRQAVLDILEIAK